MIYVMSDIHGNLRRFESIMQKIQLQPDDQLYVLGDVIDRHGDGVRILRRLMAMPNAHVLLGNHEHMMLRALNEPYEPGDTPNLEESRFIWYRNGGEVTHRYWKRIRKTLRAEVIAYLHALPLEYDVQVAGRNYKLVHAAPTELYEAHGDHTRSSTYFAVWKRWELHQLPSTPYTIIFGHTPSKHYAYHSPLRVYFGENIIDIDCGSGYPDTPEDEFAPQGNLACLRLDDMQVFYSDEDEDVATRE